MKPGGRLPTEPSLTRLSLPGQLSIREELGIIPDHLLPAVLKPADKRLLDRLGLVSRLHLGGRRRQALSRRGVALLARRDRASVSRAIRRWSVEPVDGQAPSGWRSVPGARSRPLARTIEHTEAVHRVMAALTRQAKCE